MSTYMLGATAILTLSNGGGTDSAQLNSNANAVYVNASYVANFGVRIRFVHDSAATSTSYEATPTESLYLKRQTNINGTDLLLPLAGQTYVYGFNAGADTSSVYITELI
jgi:hypothetical protein